MSNWYDPLRSIKSRGSQADRPGSLAGLAAARKVTLGQFFTPDEVAALMWRIVTPTLDALRDGVGKWRKIAILDNSIGSGRLVQFANPELHRILGVDVDQEPLAALGEAAEAAGIDCHFEPCGMESIDPRGFDVALINPPFSVHLDAPTVQPYPCTAYGRYGPHSSTVSHAYALAQALQAASVVVALLPRTFVDEFVANSEQYVEAEHAGRLAMVVDLPARSFREESTDVSVSLLVFGAAQSESGYSRIGLKSLEDTVEAPVLGAAGRWHGGNAQLNRCGVEDDVPAITLPVTGDKTVRVVHDGRRIKLKYGCGLTMAKVDNAIMRAPVQKILGPEQRFPKGVRYEGQGVLDMEVHLAQTDPVQSFEEFIDQIRAAGGEPVVDQGLIRRLKRASAQSRRQAQPLRHTVYVEGGVAGDGQSVEARPRRPQVANPAVWGSPTLSVEETYQFVRVDDRTYRFEVKGKQFDLSPEALYERFEVVTGSADAGWTTVHEGLPAAFPEQYKAWDAKAKALGIDKWLDWGYQYHDLIELAMKPVGTVAAWEMGLGKARLACALILLHGCKHGLIATEAGLVDEMRMELEGLPLARGDWQIITKPEDLRELRQINVISYERLRLSLPDQYLSKGKRERSSVKRMRDTYAGQLRRRIGVAIFDEGDLLSNPQSDQSRACWQVAARKKYVLTATPIANYPRDTAPILAFTAGDGTAAQPWGWRRGLLEPQWRETMNIAVRGVDAFRDTFVTTEWVTREFEDTLTEGAKREIPRIANLDAYRKMLAPHVKRRITQEPDVAKWIKIPVPTREEVDLEWDPAHLAFYLDVVENFTDYYQRVMREGAKGNNLIAVLAKIRAVSFASDYPQFGVEGFGAYPHLTSKQRWAIDELEELTKQGQKTVLYVENPGLAELLAAKLEQRGVEAMTFHGKKTIRSRTRELNERFRYGKCPNLIATLGVVQKGLNLWQANEEILLSRSWSATAEEQAIARLLRPQQMREVRVRYGMLRGSIDHYKGQLVAFKRDSSRAGLDWGTPETEDADFVHLSTMIGRFVEDMATLHGVASRDVAKLMASLSMKKEVEHA